MHVSRKTWPLTFQHFCCFRSCQQYLAKKKSTFNLSLSLQEIKMKNKISITMDGKHCHHFLSVIGKQKSSDLQLPCCK
eukprot:c7768_g1_i1 orf=2-232(-)